MYIRICSRTFARRKTRRRHLMTSNYALEENRDKLRSRQTKVKCLPSPVLQLPTEYLHQLFQTVVQLYSDVKKPHQIFPTVLQLPSENPHQLFPIGLPCRFHPFLIARQSSCRLLMYLPTPVWSRYRQSRQLLQRKKSPNSNRSGGSFLL